MLMRCDHFRRGPFCSLVPTSPPDIISYTNSRLFPLRANPINITKFGCLNFDSTLTSSSNPASFGMSRTFTAISVPPGNSPRYTLPYAPWPNRRAVLNLSVLSFKSYYTKR
eukprot:GHVQ01004362.1.p1 GENE.GHVQ01004362.1~~GHVQ01004362.1.p1  ORF type:complete len:111 (+),score=2.84 GHVQ01004362.1:166-498(+)